MTAGTTLVGIVLEALAKPNYKHFPRTLGVTLWYFCLQWRHWFQMCLSPYSSVSVITESQESPGWCNNLISSSYDQQFELYWSVGLSAGFLDELQQSLVDKLWMGQRRCFSILNSVMFRFNQLLTYMLPNLMLHDGTLGAVFIGTGLYITSWCFKS